LITQLEPRELAAWRNDPQREPPVLIDVREPWEFALCHIEGSQLIPLQSVPSRVEEIPEDRHIVLICHHGNRSNRVAQWLEQAGYSRLYNLRGGVEGWANDVEPGMPRY
jgi:rhodanese-related sulfurtransferase